MTTTSRPVAVVGAIIERDGSVLLCKRPVAAHLAGHWEFPGGKIEYGESPEDALQREVHEELGVTIKINGLLSVSSHVFAEKHVLFIAYECELTSGELTLNEHEAAAWVQRDKASAYKLTPGTAAALHALTALLNKNS